MLVDEALELPQRDTKVISLSPEFKALPDLAAADEASSWDGAPAKLKSVSDKLIELHDERKLLNAKPIPKYIRLLIY